MKYERTSGYNHFTDIAWQWSFQKITKGMVKKRDKNVPHREKMVFPSIWGWSYILLHAMGCPTVAIWPSAEKKGPPQLKWNKYKDFGMVLLIPLFQRCSDLLSETVQLGITNLITSHATWVNPQRENLNWPL